MGSRAVRRIAIILAVILLLAVVLDRVGVYVAERAAAQTLQDSQHLRSRPDVDIAGFPFLTQLAAAEFDEITVTAEDVPFADNARNLVINRLRVVLHDLTVTRSFHRVEARTANAEALITLGQLGDVLDVELKYAGDGRIEATKQLTIAGHTFQASLTTKPELADGALTFVETSIDNAGPLSTAAAAALRTVFDVTVPLTGIPFQVQVQEMHVDESGIVIELSGRNLVYTR